MKNFSTLFIFLIIASFLFSESSLNQVLERDDISALAATNIYDLISLKTGMIYRAGDQKIYSATGKQARICFYLNGMKMDEKVAWEMNLSKFETIEILTNNVPIKYSDFTDAVILLETRKPDKPFNVEVTAMNHSDYLQNYDIALSGKDGNSNIQFEYYLDAELSANDTRFKDEFGADPNKELPNLMEEEVYYDYWKDENPVERDFLTGNLNVDYGQMLTFKMGFLNEKLDTHPYEHDSRYAMEYSKVTDEENNYLNFGLEINPNKKWSLSADYNRKENIYSEAPNKISLDDYFTQVQGDYWNVENGFDLYGFDDNLQNFTGINRLTTNGLMYDSQWSYLSDGCETGIPGFKQPGSIYGKYFESRIIKDIFALNFNYEINETYNVSAGLGHSNLDFSYSDIRDPWAINNLMYENYLADCIPVEVVLEGDPLIDNRPDSPTYGDTLISAVPDDLNIYNQDDLYEATLYASGTQAEGSSNQNFYYAYTEFNFITEFLDLSAALKYQNNEKYDYKFDKFSYSYEQNIEYKYPVKGSSKFYPAIHLDLHPNEFINLRMGQDTDIITDNSNLYRNIALDYRFIHRHNPIHKFYLDLEIKYENYAYCNIGYKHTSEEEAYLQFGDQEVIISYEDYNGYQVPVNGIPSIISDVKDDIIYLNAQLGMDWIISPGYSYTNIEEEVDEYASWLGYVKDVEYSKSVYSCLVQPGKLDDDNMFNNFTFDMQYTVQDNKPYVARTEEGTITGTFGSAMMKKFESLDLKVNYSNELSFGEVTAYVAVKNVLDRKNELYVHSKTGSPYYDGEDLSYPGSGYVPYDTALIYTSYTADPANVSEGMTLQFGLGFRW